MVCFSHCRLSLCLLLLSRYMHLHKPSLSFSGSNTCQLVKAVTRLCDWTLHGQKPSGSRNSLSCLTVPMFTRLFSPDLLSAPPPFDYGFPNELSKAVLETMLPHGSHNIQHSWMSSCSSSTIINTSWPRPDDNFSFHLLCSQCSVHQYFYKQI